MEKPKHQNGIEIRSYGAKRNIETLATYEIYKRRKIMSLTTIVRSFEDFFTYSMKIRTEGLKEDHGEEPWSLAGK